MKKLYASVVIILLLSLAFVNGLKFKYSFYASVLLVFLLLLSLIFLPYDLKVSNGVLEIKYPLRRKHLRVRSMFPIDVRGVLRARLLGISAGKINFGLFSSTYGKVWVYTTGVDGVFLETDETMFIVDRRMVDDGRDLQEGILDA